MKETHITGRRAGGNNRHAPMRYGSLPDTHIAMTDIFIRKATGGSFVVKALDS
jgi:hypothetical protein